MFFCLCFVVFFFCFLFLCIWQRHEARFRAGGCARASNANTTSGVVIGPEVDTTHVEPVNPRKIARRVQAWIPSMMLTRQRIIFQEQLPPKRPRDISHLQFQWRTYCSSVKKLCSSEFWNFFLPMMNLSITAVDIALRAARDTFDTRDMRRGFPSNTRLLYERISTRVRPHLVVRAMHCQTPLLKFVHVLLHLCVCPCL